MPKENIYMEWSKKLWDGVLDFGEIGLKVFGAIFVIKELLYPIFKVGFELVTGIELPW